MVATTVPQRIALHFNASARLMEIRAGTIVLMRVPLARAHILKGRVHNAAARPVPVQSPSALLVVVAGYIVGEAHSTIQQYQLVQEALRAIDEDGVTAAELATMWQDELVRRQEAAAHTLSDELADMQQASGVQRWRGLGAEQGACWVWMDDNDEVVGVAA